jgi:hypothetical protein
MPASARYCFFSFELAPLTWKHAHFADSDIGQTILTCSGLFFVFALTYFFFPKIFHRQMDEKLGRFHFWANMVAVFLLLAFPIYFNLSFHSPPDESKTDRFFRALGASSDMEYKNLGIIRQNLDGTGLRLTAKVDKAGCITQVDASIPYNRSPQTPRSTCSGRLLQLEQPTEKPNP